MKPKKLLMLCLISTFSGLTLFSCGSPQPFLPWEIPSVEEPYARPIATQYNDAVDRFIEAGKYNDATLISAYYQQIEDYLNYVQTLRESIIDFESLTIKDIGSEMTYLYKYYWTLKEKAYNAYKKVLSSRGKKTFANLIGEEKAKEYQNIDTSKMFIDYTYTKFPENHVTQHTDKVMKYCTKSQNGLIVLTSISKAIMAMYDILQAYTILTIYNDIDVTDTYYTQESIYLANLLTNSQNEYNKALLTAFKSPCRPTLEKQLGKEQIDEFIASATVLPNDVLALQTESNALIAEYATADTARSKEIYLNLLNLRSTLTNKINEYSNKNYSNYAEYVYETVFYRDYTPAEATYLTNQVLENFASYWNNSKKIADTLKNRIYEKDLWNALSYTKNVVSDADEVLSYIHNHGLYNFDVSPNKFTGSYVTAINSIEETNYYLYLGATGTTQDYSSVIHEFGHYYSFYVSPDPLEAKYSQSLDLAEISSQALEMLMMDYYPQFLNEADANQLINNQINSALWALMSGSAVSAFEQQCYNYEGTLTVEKLDQIWEQIASNYLLSDYSEISYEMVSHIYQQPCYYISYVTSMLSALEIWSMQDKQAAYKVYHDLAVLGTFQPYLSTLKGSGLSDPFEDRTLFTRIQTNLGKYIK